LSIAFGDRLKLLLPSALYYPYKIAKDSRRHEPELAVLRDFVPARGTAIDVGANRGTYSYALSHVVERVEAFEPNPFLASLLRRKLGARVRVHEIALSNASGVGDLMIPQDARGADQHLRGHLCADSERSTSSGSLFQVSVRRLDDFDFDDVVFIKVDTEAADIAVLEGAAGLIARCRPTLLVELLAGGYRDPVKEIRKIKRDFGYDAWMFARGRRWDALEVFPRRRAEGVRTSNVLFTPR
jgi:FkbM family methyltransferase